MRELSVGDTAKLKKMRLVCIGSQAHELATKQGKIPPNKASSNQRELHQMSDVTMVYALDLILHVERGLLMTIH